MAELLRDHDNIAVRSASLLRLSRLGGSEVLQDLGKLVADAKQVDAVRSFAARALGLLGDRDAKPLLSEIYANSNFVDASGLIAAMHGNL